MSPDAPDECGCCAGIEAATPGLLVNRPGLSAVAYRVGTYGTFRQSLHARLSDRRWPILRGLRTRDEDDFTIALLDAWAVTGDILTFYQERIANESYLRTATERLSILEQSRLLGYQLGPGLAAATHVAFTLEDSPGLPQQAAQAITLTVGTKVQSIPGPDEQPQTFETVEAIEARPAWNALLAQQTATQPLSWDMRALWLSGSNVNVTVGEVVLIVVESGSGFEASIRRVTGVVSSPDRKSTKLSLATMSTSAETIAATRPGVYVLRNQASPFGHNAPLQPQFNSSGVFQGTFSEWALDADETVTRITLSSRNDKILKSSFAVVEQDDPVNGARTWTFATITDVVHRSVARYGIAGNGTTLSLSASWAKASSSKLDLLRTMTVSAQSEEMAPAALPLLYPVYGEVLTFDQLVEGLMPGRPLAVSGVRQALRLKHPAPAPFRGHKVPLGGTQPPPALMLDDGGSVLLTPGDLLDMIGAPATLAGASLLPLTPEEFGASLTQSVPPLLRLPLMDRDGQIGFLDISAGDIELIASDSAADPVSEIVFIDEAVGTAITQNRDRTTVQLATALTNVYERATVRINANVAAATHGESVKEPLGSGDAAVPYQQFTLRQPPVTYVSADTPDGSASTLKVYVNEVLWEEVPFFLRAWTRRAHLCHPAGRRGPHHDPVWRRHHGGAVADRAEQRAGRVSQGHRPRGARASRTTESAHESTARIERRRESGSCAGSRKSGVEGRRAHERTADGAHAGSRRVVAGLRRLLPDVFRCRQGSGCLGVGWPQAEHLPHGRRTGWGIVGRGWIRNHEIEGIVAHLRRSLCGVHGEGVPAGLVRDCRDGHDQSGPCE